MVDSKLSLFWANVAFFFFICWASEVPIIPGGQTGKYDLVINKITVAKIQGNLEWRVHHEGKPLNFSLPNGGPVDVSGTQTDNETKLSLKWTQLDESNENEPTHLVWTVKFTKKSDGSVSVDESALQLSRKQREETVKWEEPQILTSNSSFAYNCSQIEMTNKDSNSLTLNNVKIQPFDLKDGQFGDDEICSRDKSTTTVAPTTIVPTTPRPPSGNWTVSDEEKYTCIRLVGDVTLHLKYHDKNGNNLTAVVPVPAEATVNDKVSTCNFNFTTQRVMNNEQILQLDFTINRQPWALTIYFTNDTVLTHDNSRQTVVAYYVNLTYFTDKETFPNITTEKDEEVHNEVNKTTGVGALPLFKSDYTHYYRCNDNETTVVNPIFSLATQNLKVEAFLPNTTEFQKEQVCPTDQRNEPTDLIPIIIGAALTALVVFVLIAYLVGRHRARASTYETI